MHIYSAWAFFTCTSAVDYVIKNIYSQFYCLVLAYLYFFKENLNQINSSSKYNAPGAGFCVLLWLWYVPRSAVC